MITMWQCSRYVEHIWGCLAPFCTSQWCWGSLPLSSPAFRILIGVAHGLFTNGCTANALESWIDATYDPKTLFHDLKTPSFTPFCLLGAIHRNDVVDICNLSYITLDTLRSVSYLLTLENLIINTKLPLSTPWVSMDSYLEMRKYLVS